MIALSSINLQAVMLCIAHTKNQIQFELNKGS